MPKYTILLFQKYIRSFVMNFNLGLKNCKMVLEHQQESTVKLYERLTGFKEEITRSKINRSRRLRRLLGIPNVRFKFTYKGDLLFSYGAFLITNKPYCVYLETGLAPYGYDRKTADNPIARFIISLLICRKNCRKIIFISLTAQKSFLSSARYSKKTIKIFREKSDYCYPIMGKSDSPVKRYSGQLKLLSVGIFYMKGGLEIIRAFERIREKYSNVTLTMITSLAVMRQEDIDLVKNISGITLLNAQFGKEEMDKFYAEHDLFLSPTYRDGFGLAWIEAISHGLPIIGTHQYATKEMGVDKYNAFLFPRHPLADFDSETGEIYGLYYDPKNFYTALFEKQKRGEFRPVEDFLYSSIERFLKNTDLLEEFSRHSLNHYRKNFHPSVLGEKIENIFINAIKNE